MLETLKGRTDALEPTMVTLTEASDVFPLVRHPGTEFIYMLAGKNGLWPPLSITIGGWPGGSGGSPLLGALAMLGTGFWF